MRAERTKLGEPVKVGFLTLFLVGHYRGGRLLRNAVATEFYDAPYYAGCHKLERPYSSHAVCMIELAARFDPIVKSALDNLKGV